MRKDTIDMDWQAATVAGFTFVSDRCCAACGAGE